MNIKKALNDKKHLITKKNKNLFSAENIETFASFKIKCISAYFSTSNDFSTEAVPPLSKISLAVEGEDIFLVSSH